MMLQKSARNTLPRQWFYFGFDVLHKYVTHAYTKMRVSLQFDTLYDSVCVGYWSQILETFFVKPL